MRRDRYQCRCCGKPGKDRQGGDEYLEYHSASLSLVDLDAHHIQDRNQMPNGGYVKENGISVCDDCHVLAEVFHQTGEAVEGFSPEDLFQMIGSSLEEAVAASKRL